ncbi:MAG: TetR/AcrR family transcriptional regulator [Acidobacteria bacterium]|nr:TetR/AcrR family transcriptional regulator [Acidobacteriota bacterium]
MGRPPTITRDRLLLEARRVFAAKGFEAATLADIAAALNVTPAAILRHVASKQELFRESMLTDIPLPSVLQLFETVDPAADPRIVLRRVAEGVVPFIMQMVQTNIAVFMHAQTTSMVVPFDTAADNSPPRRGLRIIENYFRRAAKAGVVRIASPRAAALLFMGSLQSYVFMHHVVNVQPVYPLADYIDALLDLWSHGGICEIASENDRPRSRRPGGGGGRAVVPAGKPKAAGSRPVRDSGGEDGERRVARRRPRDPRSRR